MGRDEELDSLARALGIHRADEAHQVGHDRAVVVSGDAGVGKTRLLTALRDLAFAEGWQVVAGHCLDFGDSALPYLPFSEILSRLLGSSADLVDEVTAQRPALSRLRPGRRMLSEAEPAEGASMERRELLEAMHALLEAAGRRTPLLLVVEDVHWADRSTRDMLSFLFSRSFASPVAMVVSYRSDDLHRRHPLRRTAAEWSRAPGIGRLHLGPLGAPDVRAFVRVLHPEPLRESDVARIVSRAEGNAFFVEELVGAVAQPGRGVPDDLVELLLVRLDQLSEPARQVARAASVAGRRVRHDQLVAVTDLPAQALDGALREAVEHNVLEPARGDSYAFRHALLGEAVYDDLLPGERTRFHAAYARALDEGRASGTAAELARHARAAHDLVTAVHASVRAGDDAMAVGGPDEAAHHFETALELLADPALPADIGTDVAAVAARASEALIATGDPQRALSLVQRALADLPADASDLERGRLTTALASTVMVAETTLRSLDLTTEALRLIPEEPSQLRARALHLHARSLNYDDRLEAARVAALDALSMAESLDMPRLASDVMASLAAIDRDLGKDVQDSFEEVAAVARRRGATTAELRSLWLLGRWHWDRAEFAAAGEAFRRIMQRAEETGLPWAPYAFDARFGRIQVDVVTGRWDDAVALTDVTGQSPPALAESLLAAIRLTVHAGRGEVDRLDLLPHIRSTWQTDGLIVITGGIAAIELLARRGDLTAVVAMHDDVVETITALWRRYFHGRVRLAAITLGALSGAITSVSSAARAELAEHAIRIADGGRHTLDLRREMGTHWGPEGQAWEARLAAESLRFAWMVGAETPDRDELIAAWRADLALFETLGNVPEVARSQVRLADVLQAGGENLEEVAELAAQARRTAEGLGAVPLLEELDALIAPAGGASATAAQPQVRPAVRSATLDEPLTRREHEILLLVAQGRSNGEIGKRLFIATKTVSVHVSRILAKLGASGRTEAAAIARERGLLR